MRARATLALLLAASRAHAWSLPSRSPSISASPGPLVFTPFPGTTAVGGNALNAVVDFLRPVPSHAEASFVARRLVADPPSAPARRRALQAAVALPAPAPALPRLTCAAAPRRTANLSALAPVWHVSDWCFLAHLQPSVPATLVALRSVTVFIPTDEAFRLLLLSFPAFYEWLTTLPSCAAAFNRLEYFLLSHATSLNVTCFSLRCAHAAVSPPVRTLNAPAWEKLALGVLTQGGAREGSCTPRPGNSTCVVDRVAGFDVTCRSSAHVEWEFLGNNGRVLPISRVMPPLGHAWAAFPRTSLYGAITGHPQLGLFTQLLYNAGLLGDLLLANASWRAKTVFAPLDAAFGQLTQRQLDYLLGPAGRALARYVALSHVLRGVTYVYSCALAAAAATLGNVTQATESGAQVVVGVARHHDDGWVLSLSFPAWMSVPTWAETAPGGADIETTTGLLHPVGGLLLDSWVWGRLAQGVQQ